MAGRRSSRVTNIKVFLLSGFETARRRELGQKIQSLDGKYFDIKDFHAGCTHVVCDNISRSEKFLGACSTGKWVLHPHYIDDSCIAGCWLDEEQYEWCDDHIYKRFKGDYTLALAARRWRFLLGDASTAFTGWKVAVVAAPKKAQVIKRLLFAGGAEIYNLKFPVKNPARVADNLGYIFVSANMMSSVAHLIDYGALLMKPEFIADFLINDPQPDPMDYLVQTDDTSTLQDVADQSTDFLMASQRSVYLSPKKTQTSNLSDADVSPSLSQPSTSVAADKHQTSTVQKSPVPKKSFTHSQTKRTETLPAPDTGPSTSGTRPQKIIHVDTEMISPSKIVTSASSSVTATTSSATTALASSSGAGASLSQNITGSSTLSLIEVIDLTGSDDEEEEMRKNSKQTKIEPLDNVNDDSVMCSVPSMISQSSKTSSGEAQIASTPHRDASRKTQSNQVSHHLKQLQQAIIGMSPITKFFKRVENEEVAHNDIKDKKEVRTSSNLRQSEANTSKATVKSTSGTKDTLNNQSVKVTTGKPATKRKSTDMDSDNLSSEPIEKKRAIRKSLPFKPVDKVHKQSSGKTDGAVKLDFVNKGLDNSIKDQDSESLVVNSDTHVQRDVSSVSSCTEVVDKNKKDKVSLELMKMNRVTRKSLPSKKVKTKASHKVDRDKLGANTDNDVQTVFNNVSSHTEPDVRIKIGTVKCREKTKRNHDDKLYEVLLDVKRRKISHCEWFTTDIVNLKQSEDNTEASCISSASTEIIHTTLEDGSTSMGLWLLRNHLSLKTYLQPKTVATLIQEILLTTKDQSEAFLAYYVLRRMLVLHPPITEVMQNLYLHSFSGTDVWLDRQVGAEWDFICNCISTILTGNKETSGRYILLFKFISGMLQCNMQKFVVDPEMRADIRNKNMLIRIFWCPSYHIVFNSKCRKLLVFMSETIQLCKQEKDQKRKEHLFEMLDGILWLVAMVTECARLQDDFQDSMAALQSDKISVFVHEIAKALIDLDIRDPVLLQRVFQSLRLSWLRVGVCQQMLNVFDDYLLVEEHNNNMINFLTIVSRYFFLLPQFDNPHGQLDTASPARVRTLKSRRSSTNKNNNKMVEDSSMNKENINKMCNKVNKRNHKGETPLHTACIRNNVTTVRKLLEVPGIDVNAQDNAGWTPLHEACNHGNTECVRELLKFVPAKTVDTFFKKGNACKKVNLLAVNEDGITPLHDAVLNSRLEVCKMLLQHGGQVLLTQRTRLNYTPLDLCDSEEMYNLLSSFDATTRKLSDSVSLASGSQDSISSCEDNLPVLPSDTVYQEVLNLDGKRVYANRIQLFHYLHLINVLVRNYICTKDLTFIVDKLKCSVSKSHCIERAGNCDISSQSCSHGDQGCFISSAEIDEKPLLNEASPGSVCLNGIKVTEQEVLKLKDELKALKRLKCHVDLFRNHLKKISKAEDHGSIEGEMLELDCLVELLT